MFFIKLYRSRILCSVFIDISLNVCTAGKRALWQAVRRVYTYSLCAAPAQALLHAMCSSCTLLYDANQYQPPPSPFRATNTFYSKSIAYNAFYFFHLSNNESLILLIICVGTNWSYTEYINWNIKKSKHH